MSIVPQTCDEENTFAGEPLIPLVIHIPAIKNRNGSRLEVEFPGDLHFRGSPFGDHGEAWQVSIMIQHQVQLGCPFGALVPGPVVHARTQLEERAVDAHQRIAETKAPVCPSHMLTASEK